MRVQPPGATDPRPAVNPAVVSGDSRGDVVDLSRVSSEVNLNSPMGHWASTGDGGAHLSDALRRPAPQRRLAGAAAEIVVQPIAPDPGGADPGAHHRAVAAAGSAPQAHREAARMPWQWPPAWMYLPSQGIGVGDDTPRAMPEQRDTVDSRALAREADRSVHHRDHGMDTLDASPRGGGPIRGQVDWSLQLPGARGEETADTGGETTRIRGQGHLPGPEGGREVAAWERRQRRLLARHSTIQQSLADHADRVAAKRAREEPQAVAPTAAERIAAVRRRIAERGSLPGARHLVPSVAAGHRLGDDSRSAAAQHAAAREAHHGVAPA